MGKIGDIERWVRASMTLRNIGDQPSRSITDTIACRYVVAVLGAWAAEAGTYPIDLAKTRLQIQSEIATTKVGYKMEHRGMIRTIIHIAQKEGITKLFSGVVPMLQRHAVYAGCRLVFYEQYRSYFRDPHGNLSFGMGLTGALGSGALAQLIATPADVVKTNMQAEGRRILQGKTPRFRNCRDCYRTLYRESGILGFWRGAIPNITRSALVTLADIAAYDYSKQFLVRKFGMADNALLHGAAALNAGFVGASLATPADVIKTRLMNQPVGTDGKGLLYKGIIDCVQQSVGNEGFFALYKGFFPMWLRLGPWAVIYWLTFENIMLAIGGKTF